MTTLNLIVNILYLILLGSVKVWDPRQKDKPVANMTPAEGEEGRDCWCVAFGKTPMFFLSVICIMLGCEQAICGKRKYESKERKACLHHLEF